MKKTFTIIALLIGVISQAQSLTDSLVAYYPFTGDTKDHSGKGNDLTAHNVMLTADRNGQANAAYLFNGTNSYLGLTSASSLFLDSYSYSCWFRIDALPNQGTTQAIMSVGGDVKDNGFNLSNKYAGIYSGIGSWTYLKNSQATASVDDPSFNDANWHHIVATRNNDSIIVYLDGAKLGSDYTGDAAGYTGQNLGFYIGCRTGNVLFFKGVVDDIRIWNRILSASDVTQLFNSTATSVKPIGASYVLNLYPNPNSGSFKIDCNTGENLSYKIFTSVGTEILTGKLSKSQSFDLNQSGLYFISIFDQNGYLLEKKQIIVN
ncbi:MAG: T9SS type A sorting domain-containing protein [Bacteroidetes bacterium]|nr:T9SS type A sorting domain-containing protein [Bacteroidota bacterium]